MPGSPGQTYYYAPDQIGSVRRVFESASIAPAYDYDPWGNLLQVTPPPTDFGFAGMFNEPDSGLYLTQYRAYDPVAGRWLSRDPLGDENIGIVLRIIHPGQTFTASEDLWHIERDDNLYAYVDNNPVNLIDPTGELGRLPSPSTGSSFCPVANKPDIKQFNDAIREIGKAIGRPVTRGERRMIHDAVTGQGLGYHDIISEGISLLGK